jgi:hypothetical protein
VVNGACGARLARRGRIPPFPGGVDRGMFVRSGLWS